MIGQVALPQPQSQRRVAWQIRRLANASCRSKRLTRGAVYALPEGRGDPVGECKSPRSRDDCGRDCLRLRLG